jgi:hypothetical protein
MKQCKSCKQEIDSKATKCPHCQADQRNWFSRHKVITAIVAIIVFLGIIGAASSGGNTTEKAADVSTKTSSEPESTTAGIGQPARDGRFEFTVNSIKCGVTTAGKDFLTKSAQGQYCLLNVTVKNIEDQSQSLFSSNQYLFDGQNRKFTADDTAGIYASPQGSSWYSEINPGNSVTGDIYFDVPKDAEVVSAELHDSAFSGGIKVNLK